MTSVGHVLSDFGFGEYELGVLHLGRVFVGVGMLGVNLYKYFKGDPTSNDALTKIGGGLLVAVIILQVINYTML